jgi:hypothetical protein
MKGMCNLIQKGEGGRGGRGGCMMRLETEVEADLKRPTTNTITLLLNVEDPAPGVGTPEGEAT